MYFSGMWISPKKFQIHCICLVHSVIPQYSASVDESLTYFCHLESQETILFAKNIAYPIVEQEVSTSPAQSVSE